MLVHLLKFTHLIFTLGLLGSAISCLILVGSKKFVNTPFHQPDIITRLNKAMLVMGLFAGLTGTLLVYPKNYTFQTHWIQAAYVFLTLFGLSIASLIFLKKKNIPRWVWVVSYLILLAILIGITHDAVSKSTFLFSS